MPPRPRRRAPRPACNRTEDGFADVIVALASGATFQEHHSESAQTLGDDLEDIFAGRPD